MFSQISPLHDVSRWIGTSRLRAYGFAVACTGAAYLVRTGLDLALGSRPTFSLFAFAVMATAVFGGAGPAILAMVLSAVAVDIFIFEPVGGPSLAARDIVELVMFMIIAGGMIALTRLAFGAARRAEAALDRQDQLSDRLQTEEATQRAILATIPDAMVVIDAKGVVQSFSNTAEQLFGYEAAEVCGKNVKILMPQPFRDEHDGYIDRFRRTGEARIIGRGRTVTALKKDGTTFPMDLAVGEANVGGKRTFVGFIRDLTAKLENDRHLQSLQSELLHASRLTAMGEMSAALAHELNQPLTAISNYAKAAHRTLAGSTASKIEDAQGMIDKAAAQSIRAGQIIKRLREFVEHREVSRGMESPVKVVEEAMVLGLADVADSGVRVRSTFDPATPPVYIDKIQIQQVLINLMRNAIEAMQAVERRELDIKVFAADGGIEISICDSGPGLAPEVAERLFQPFVTTKKTGMGVGLSICQSIMQGHSGRIWVTPNESAGITFHLSLPAAGAET
ncbi:MAG: PAS domain S-box protein [Rhodospirillaceae bacterium]